MKPFFTICFHQIRTNEKRDYQFSSLNCLFPTYTYKQSKRAYFVMEICLAYFRTLLIKLDNINLHCFLV